MPQTILLKRSATPGAIPAAANLALGEVAVNTSDGNLFTKKNDGTVVTIGGGALTKIAADALYQPRLANMTYANQTAIPLMRSVASYQGDLCPNITGTLGGTGQYKNILNGIVHHPSAPNVPYGYMAGEYFQNVAVGQLDSYRLFATDYREIGLFLKPAGISFNSSVTVRQDLVSLTAGTDTNSSSITLSSVNGAVYNPPAGFTISDQSILNRLQMDDRYIKKSDYGAINLVEASPVVWPADPMKIAILRLTSSRQLAFPTGAGLVPGATYTLIVVQGALNTPCDIGWIGNYLFPNKTKPALSRSNYAVDIFSFIYDGTNMYGAVQRNFGIGG